MNDASSPGAATPRYVGFWMRVVAALIDSVLIVALVYPLLILWFGTDRLFTGRIGLAGTAFEMLLPAVAVIVCWRFRSATPGKLVIGARILDARTLGAPSTAQLVGRYLGYYVSSLPLGMGLLWVAFDPRKRGWHDLVAGTVVIRDPRRG